MSAGSFIITILVVILIAAVLITLIKDILKPSTIDEEMMEYERLLREREKRGIGALSSYTHEAVVPVPIISRSGYNINSLNMPTSNDEN